jgi:hypothetical protein
MLWFLLFTLGDALVEVVGIYMRTRRFDVAGARMGKPD